MIQKLRKKGFTLIEVFIVIIIIGILSAIAIPNFLAYKAKHDAEKAKQEVVVEKSKPEIEKPRPEPGLKKITRYSKNYEIFCIYC